MMGAVQRASGWLQRRVRAMIEWPCRDELAHLREQRARFLAMLDAVEDQVILAGPDGLVGTARIHWCVLVIQNDEDMFHFFEKRLFAVNSKLW